MATCVAWAEYCYWNITFLSIAQGRKNDPLIAGNKGWSWTTRPRCWLH